jgi:folate-binding protein YgfZ
MPEKTPAYEAEAASGAVFQEEAGWLVPARFAGTITEYENAYQQAALFDLSHHGKIRLAGKDAGQFLHNLCTNEVLKLTPGSGCEAFLTTGQAKTVAYVLIFRMGSAESNDVFDLDVGPGMADKVARHLDRYLISEAVEIQDQTTEFAQFHLAGPKSKEVLERVFKIEAPDLALLQHRTCAAGDMPCLLRRHDPLGVPGFDILVPRERGNELWQALQKVDAKPAGLLAYDILRLEAGTPVYTRDIDETNLPTEVARVDQTISFTKGCYIGQETIARIRTYGHVNRSLVGLKVNSDAAIPGGTKLFRDGKAVGQVTSSVVSPRLGTAIALAYVRRGNQEPGTVMELFIEGKPVTATAAALPMITSA